MKILMGTKNQGKIEGVKRAFERYFDNVEIEGIPVDSEVGAQPINKEIIIGARNRVKNVKEYAKKNNIDADYYVASEAGITDLLDDWIDINTVVIENKEGKQSVGTSQGFPIDAKYIDDELWVTAKLDKGMWPETLDRMVRIEFNLYDLPKGKYDLVICVENAIGINRDQKSWEFD